MGALKAMSAEAPPLAPSPNAGQIAPDRPRRLPFLWVLCVILGLEGMLGLAVALCMKPLGMLLLALLALVYSGIGACLYLRLRVGLYAGLALCWLTLARIVFDEMRSHGADALSMALSSLVILLVALYLYLRRRHFGRSGVGRPRVLSLPGISALVVVLALSGGLLLLMLVDDPRQSFPTLQAQVTVPPRGENAFPLMEQMRAKWPLWDDEEISKVWGGMPQQGAAPDAAWERNARALVQKYAGCLGQVPELAARPHFVPVPFLKGMDRNRRGWAFLAFTRRLAHLLAISAHLQALGGQWHDALAESQLTVRLGLLVSKESTGVMQTLVGTAVVGIGLRSVQEVASAAPRAALVRACLASPVPEDEFRSGYNLAVAQDFQRKMSMFKALQKGGPAAILDAMGEKQTAPRPGFFARNMKKLPLLKLNMTHNLLGRVMRTAIIRTDTYTLPPPDPLDQSGKGAWGFIRAVGILHFARNPVGDILVEMVVPANEHLVRVFSAR
jgi:hypothetical protein